MQFYANRAEHPASDCGGVLWWISARQRGCRVCAEGLGAGIALPLSIYHNYRNYHKPCAQPWPRCHLCLVTLLLQGRACKAESCWQLLTPAARFAFLPLLLLKTLHIPRLLGTFWQNESRVRSMESETGRNVVGFVHGREALRGCWLGASCGASQDLLVPLPLHVCVCFAGAFVLP